MKSEIISLLKKICNVQHCDQTGNKTRESFLKAEKSEAQKQRRKAHSSKDL